MKSSISKTDLLETIFWAVIASGALCALVYAEEVKLTPTPEDLATEHVFTTDGNRPDSAKGMVGLFLHGHQHCGKLQRGVIVDKEAFEVVAGCWAAPSKPGTEYQFVADKGSDVDVHPAFAFQDGSGTQVVVLQKGSHGCANGRKKAFLFAKQTNQVLEGCWEPAETDSYQILWDEGEDQHVGPLIPELYLYKPGTNIAPHLDPRMLNGPQIES
jgi:hypothetical protein